MNARQLAGAKCQQAAVARDEFKKLVYDSSFTKRAEEMGFVNFWCGYELSKKLTYLP